MNKWLIRKSALDVILLCITFFEPVAIPHLVFLIIKYAILGYLFLTYFPEVKHMKKVAVALTIYGGITFLSTVLNQNSINRYVSSFVYTIHLLSIFCVIHSYVRVENLDTLIGLLIKIFSIFIIVNDLAMLVVEYDFQDPQTMYLLGNKFTVSYLHCFWAALFYLKYNFSINDKFKICVQKKHLVSVIAFFYTTIICMRVSCTTGVLMCVLMFLLLYFPLKYKLKSFLANPQIIVVGMFCVNFLILSNYGLLRRPFVANFVSNILGETYTWTGRLLIYDFVLDLIREKLWIGYGYFSDVIADILGWGNAQNGVLKILIDSGVIGLFSYTLMVCESVKESFSKKIWPLYVFIYSMLFASLAEINLIDNLFFLTIAIINARPKSLYHSQPQLDISDPI